MNFNIMGFFFKFYFILFFKLQFVVIFFPIIRHVILPVISFRYFSTI